MKILVIYDSYYGNGTTIAKAIANTLKQDNDVELVKIGSKPLAAISSFDIIVIGSPTRAFSPTKPIKDFVMSLPSNLKNTVFAVYDTNTDPQSLGKGISLLVKLFNYSNDTLVKLLENKGYNNVACEKFYVMSNEGPLKKGELERAIEFANYLNTNL